MEATRMKVLGVIGTTAVFLLLGATVPAFAQEDHQEEGAKPAQHEEQAKPAAKQEQTKPQKQEAQVNPAKQEQAKPQKQEEQQQAKGQQQQQEKQQQQQAKSSKQEQQQQETKQQQQQVKTQQNEEKSQQHQQANGQAQQSQGQYARNGQKDSYGHEYNESHFGPNHHARFEENGGRYYNGRREYSYGGYWFYAGAYPPWFYQQDVYFIMGADGLWYAVASGNPSLTFQVNIG
jgi:DNA polymerase III gamma/tau subunit